MKAPSEVNLVTEVLRGFFPKKSTDNLEKMAKIIVATLETNRTSVTPKSKGITMMTEEGSIGRVGPKIL